MKLSTSLIWLSIACLFLSSPSLAQTKELDSIEALLKTSTDTTRVDLLRNKAYLIRSTDMEKALALFKESVDKSEQLGYARGQIYGLYNLAITHGMASNYIESLEYLGPCLSLAKKHEDIETIIDAYMTYGIIYKRIGDYVTSQNYYLKSLKVIDSLQFYHYEAVSHTYINLGILYDLMEQQNKALDSYKKALELAPVDEYEKIEHRVLFNLSDIDIQNIEYQKALDKLLKAAAYSEKQEDIEIIGLSNNYAQIGFCYLKLEQWEQSEKYLKQSLELAQKLSLQQEIAIAYAHLAQLMLEQNKNEEAIFFSKKNLEALEVNGEYEFKEKAHNLASQIYTKTGNYPKANYHLKQTMAYQDSLLNETKVREIQNLQIQHDVYLKDKEISEGNLKVALLNAEVAEERKRLIYLGIIAALLLFSAGLLYYRFLAKKKSNKIFLEQNQRITEQNKTIEKINAELEKRMLRAQMNPHFIFNSLNSIQHLIINSKDRTHALKYLTKFSKLLRQVLESSVNISLSLKEEIDLLKIYLELESLRFDNAFAFNIEVDNNLDVDEHEIPLLLVQPYVENAIVHGLMPKNGEKELRIIFNDIGDYIECTVEDNGVGINSKKPEQKKSKRPSRGMSITEKRINALKKVSNEQLVTVENLDTAGKTGTRVTIRIPKQETGDYYATEKKLVS